MNYFFSIRDYLYDFSIFNGSVKSQTLQTKRQDIGIHKLIYKLYLVVTESVFDFLPFRFYHLVRLEPPQKSYPV